MNKSLVNGAVWYDTDGNPIHAHGGHILSFGGNYYWYGENRLSDNYVSCYRSSDLLNWEFRRNVLTTASPAEKTRVHADISLTRKESNGTAAVKKVNLERPKVLYNAPTGRFVMWAHYENGADYHDARCAVASCDKPDGDFVYHGSFNPYGFMSRDCTLYMDDDGTAYFISASRDNADTHVYRLTDDFLNIDRHVNTLWQGEYREAPAVFKREDVYYMLNSHCTGWTPNQGEFSRGKSLDGSWDILRNFGDSTTFRSQPAFVLPVNIDGKEKDKTSYFYFGDRWGANIDLYFTSSYVVLPIEFDETGAAYITWRDEFKLN